MENKGYVHLYTGHGKGKTTAALGVALRAAGHGMRTLMIQFMKGQHYGEIDAVKKLDGLVEIEQHGSPLFCNLDGADYPEHYRLAREGLRRTRESLHDKTINILVLDEIVTAYLFKLITLDEIVQCVLEKPAEMELVLTGRGAPPELFALCDIVTEMKEVKHYHTGGVEARKGIEY
jgi:cob(I)alamin adenosyltransferase